MRQASLVRIPQLFSENLFAGALRAWGAAEALQQSMTAKVHRLVVPRRGNEATGTPLDQSEEAARMVNAAFFGAMLDNQGPRNEFLQECLALERNV